MIIETLQKIQTELKAPKGQYNSFGKYKYRNCEDILESVKPILSKYSAAVTLEDEVIGISDRIYIKATATLYCGDEKISVCAYAREAAEKKGMDESQITGACSSYARKYALNGLFAIDDTKDADNQNNGDEKPKKTAKVEKTPSANEEKSEKTPVADEELVLCENCNNFITSAKNQNTGEIFTIPRILNISTEKFKKKLCWKCMCEIGKKGS